MMFLDLAIMIQVLIVQVQLLDNQNGLCMGQKQERLLKLITYQAQENTIQFYLHHKSQLLSSAGTNRSIKKPNSNLVLINIELTFLIYPKLPLPQGVRKEKLIIKEINQVLVNMNSEFLLQYPQQNQEDRKENINCQIILLVQALMTFLQHQEQIETFIQLLKEKEHYLPSHRLLMLIIKHQMKREKLIESVRAQENQSMRSLFHQVQQHMIRNQMKQKEDSQLEGAKEMQIKYVRSLDLLLMILLNPISHQNFQFLVDIVKEVRVLDLALKLILSLISEILKMLYSGMPKGTIQKLIEFLVQAIMRPIWINLIQLIVLGNKGEDQQKFKGPAQAQETTIINLFLIYKKNDYHYICYKCFYCQSFLAIVIFRQRDGSINNQSIIMIKLTSQLLDRDIGLQTNILIRNREQYYFGSVENIHVKEFLFRGPGVRYERQFPVQLAQTHKAMIIVLEHRFYGKSMPFGQDGLKIESFKYLSIRQALDDLAYFQMWIIQNQMFGIKQYHPWIAIGGSYPGAMAAWYRYQYQHLVVGALASSAVVEILTDFPKFDTQVYLSALKSDQECADNLRALNIYAENNLSEVRSRLQADLLTEEEFLFYFTDAIILKIQYGGRTKLCDDLKGKQIEEQIDYFIQRALVEDNPQSYGSYYLKDDVYDENKLRSSRQWKYQCCTEVGWWQTAPQVNSLRSDKLDIDFYKQYCKDIFGEDLQLWPDEEITNAIFGGNQLKVDNIIFTNGDEDPWKWVSIIENKEPFKVYHINCTNAGHCVELYTPTDGDCQQLKQVRVEISDLFGKWIQEHYQKIKFDY